ncbi:MAG TPA: replication-associated recombination protein A [Nonomuraea sp.]|nr:replication-associated recombination protein A [Nonomuraea sp.]
MAARMRPRTLDEVVGQDHLLQPGAPLRRLVDAAGRTGPAAPSSVLLWGPAGTGKTTLARIISAATGRKFVELSAVSAGVKDVRDALTAAKKDASIGAPETVLFLDEVHRFSKAQQDSLLHGVEDRTVTLVAATTENPHFSVISPLLSRSLLLTLRPLTDADVGVLIDRALVAAHGLGGAVTLAAAAREHLLRIAGGDARRALTALEAAAGAALDLEQAEVSLDLVEHAVAQAAARYDRDGDQHYDVISAFIKSLRGSDVDAALHYLARMIEAGEDPRFIARRLVILASEDIGMADSTALLTAVAAAQAVQLIGMPEAQLNLAHATIALATAPKSNAVTTALGAATNDLRAGVIGAVPGHLRDSHYPGAAKLGHGKGYKYAHDYPHGVVAQQYAPDEVAGKDYYAPTANGAEKELSERVARLRGIVRGDTD